MKSKTKTRSTPTLTVRDTPPPAYAVPPLPVLRRSERDPPGRWCTEVNERCIEMLVHAARHERQSFALVTELRELFALTTPATRRRMAERVFLLVDLHFLDAQWWSAVRRRPTDAQRNPAWQGSFPRQSAVQLTRATLLLAWNCLRVDPTTACVLFGMTASVAGLLTSLTLNDIDTVSQKHFRHVHARWDDRPAVWRKLLLAAQASEDKPMGEFNLHGLQLLAGALWAPNTGGIVKAADRSKTAHRGDAPPRG